MPKNNPIPVRFAPDEEEALKWVAETSGLPVSEVIRRAVFLLNQEVKKRGGKVGWIAEELNPAKAHAPIPARLKEKAARKDRAA